MESSFLLKTKIRKQEKSDILEKIKKHLSNPQEFLHIVSLNPENIVIACEDLAFQKILNNAEIQLIDGIGVAWGCAILGIPHAKRIAGADFMKALIDMGGASGLCILLLGGRPNVADKLAKCYQKIYPQSKIIGDHGFEDVKNPTEEELDSFFSIVAFQKPQIILTAFGSPEQEFFLERHKVKLNSAVGMGVGGGFDFASKNIMRAPVMIRQTGLEWLFRLITQPWRWRRQLRLISFVRFVFFQKIRGIFHKA